MTLVNKKYLGPSKAWWRRSIWNALRDRLNKGDTVVTLIGETALDLLESKRVGLKCVGVDKLKRSVSVWRKAGGVAIQADVHEVLQELKPEGVILDHLCDVSYPLCFPPAKKDCQIVFNFQRGRTPSHQHDNPFVKDILYDRSGGDLPPLHRGRYVMVYRLAERYVTEKLEYEPESVQGAALNLYQSYENYGKNAWTYRADGTKGLYFDSILIQSFGNWTYNVKKKTNNKLSALKAVITKANAH